MKRWVNCSLTVKKKATWTHRFVCLAMHGQTSIPTTSWAKDELLSAGLGERKILFNDVDCDTETFKNTLFENFPKLRNAGGFELCKCKPNSRELESLSGVVLSSPRALQSCGGNSRTYIRPIQMDLELTKELEHVDVCIFTCIPPITIYSHLLFT